MSCGLKLTPKISSWDDMNARRKSEPHFGGGLIVRLQDQAAGGYLERDILDAACEVWNRIIDQPWQIMSIGLRQWAHNGQSL